MKFSQDLQETMKYLNNELHTDRNFDVVYRVLTIGGKNACLYFIDGFTKDDTLLKLLQALSSHPGRPDAKGCTQLFQAVPSLWRDRPDP